MLLWRQIPIVMTWSQKINIAPSKLLIPLSYASIVGNFSLIATSTNLVVKALLVAREKDFVLPIFEVFYVGFPTMIISLA